MTFSSNLLIVRNFEIGRYEAGKDGSNAGFFSKGVMIADLKETGNTPSEKHKLNRSQSKNEKMDEHDFKT